MKKKVTKSEIRSVPAPAGTRTWNPVSHRDVVDRVDAQLQLAGIDTRWTRFDVTNNGHIAYGIHALAIPTMGQLHEICLGWLNSTNKRKALLFGVGSHILACLNLTFSSEWTDFAKHTGNLEISKIDLKIQLGIQHARQKLDEYDTYYNITLPNYRVDFPSARDIIGMECVRQRIINIFDTENYLNAADEEYKRYGSTLMSIYNAITQQFRNKSAREIDYRSTRLDNLMHVVMHNPKHFNAAILEAA